MKAPKTESHESHANHGGSHGINPGVPATVGTALGVVGALMQPAPRPPPPAAAFRYTDQPGFTGPAGQPCRHYVAGAHYGTACQGIDGGWHIAN